MDTDPDQQKDAKDQHNTDYKDPNDTVPVDQRNPANPKEAVDGSVILGMRQEDDDNDDVQLIVPEKY